MYCPVDGMEYQEGITRCPEHDVPLVDDPLVPEEEERPLFSWAYGEGVARVAFLTVVGAAATYAVAAIAVSAALTFAATGAWFESTGGRLILFLETASRAVGLGAFGCLAGGVLVRGYARLGTSGPPSTGVPATIGATWLMPLLFALLAVFTAAWAVTGILMSDDAARFEYAPPVGYVGGGGEQPPESFYDLAALNHGAYVCALAALALMGAETLRRADVRLRARRGG